MDSLKRFWGKVTCMPVQHAHQVSMHVETFAQHYNEEANPFRFKWENDGSFPLIYRAGEFEVSKSKVIEIKSFQSMHYRTCHLSWECWRTYMYLKIVCKICGLFTMNKESLTEEQCEKWFQIRWCKGYYKGSCPSLAWRFNVPNSGDDEKWVIVISSSTHGWILLGT